MIPRRSAYQTRRLLLAFAAILIATGGGLAGPPPTSPSQSGLTVDRLTSQPLLAGTSPSRPVWSHDSRDLAFLWNDRAMPFCDVWVVSGSGGTPRRVTDMAQAHPYPPVDPSDLAQQATAHAEIAVPSRASTRPASPPRQPSACRSSRPAMCEWRDGPTHILASSASSRCTTTLPGCRTIS